MTPRERRRTYQYVQCAACSLAFVANPPPESEILNQYNTGVSSKLAYYWLAAAADARSFRSMLDLIERYEPKGQILDVGCNIGTFVSVAVERGWLATGVDVNFGVVELGRSKNGLDLVTPERLDARPRQQFDVIHTSDTVEHFTDPTEAMRSYVHRLKPGGLLVVSTPNYDSMLCKMFQLKPTEHLYLFNKQSLGFLLRKLGLDVIDTVLFDRCRNISAMFESTTFEHMPVLKQAFQLLYRIRPELIVRLNGGENVVAIARTPELQQ